jgi:hypothetical protein
VEPNVAFDALFTSTALVLDEVELAGAVAACEEEPDVLELLPHAARVSDAANAGTNAFIARCI